MYEDWPDNVPIPFKCDKSYDPTFEVCKYFLQLLYLVPGAILQILVLRAIFVTHKKIFRVNSFYVIFSMDCVASLYLILIEIFWYRIMRYFMPFCDFFAGLLVLSPTNQRYFYCLYQYARGAKSVVQIFLTMNRMTCVILPTMHNEFWKYGVRIAILTTLLIPLTIVYNPLFARYYPGNINGGVITRFSRPIVWLNIASIHLGLVIIAVIVTIICTSLTLYGMISLPKRLKYAEKSLCIASFIISAGFFIVGLVQLALAVCDCDPLAANLLLVILTFGFDFLNVCTPLTVILISSQLRSQLISKGLATVEVKGFTQFPNHHSVAVTHYYNTSTLNTINSNIC